MKALRFTIWAPEMQLWNMTASEDYGDDIVVDMADYIRSEVATSL